MIESNQPRRNNDVGDLRHDSDSGIGQEREDARRAKWFVSKSPSDANFEADLSLRRLMPRVNECWEQHGISESLRHEFQVRLEANWDSLVHAAV